MKRITGLEYSMQADHGDSQLDASDKRLVLLARALVGLAIAMMMGGLWAASPFGINMYQLIREDVFEFLTIVFFTPATTVAYATVGSTILSRQPRHGIGWLMAAISFLYGFGIFHNKILVDWITSAAGGTLGPFLGVLITFFYTIWMATNYIHWVLIPLYFPTGKLISKRYRFFVIVTLISLVLVMLSFAIAPLPIDGQGDPNPYGIEGAQPIAIMLAYVIGAPLLLIGLFGGLRSFVVRYRQGNTVERSQIKILVYLFVISILIYTISPILVNILPQETFPAFDFGIFWSRIYTLLIPIAFWVAILRHNLWDIDIIINRTLVYGGLSFLVIAIYLVVVSGSALLFQTDANPYSGLIAAGIIAVIFQPVRERLQNRVNRLIYGERDNPAAVLSHLAHHSETAESTTDVLPNLAQNIADQLKIPYVAICTSQIPSLNSPLASWGQPTSQTDKIPLVFQNQEIGELIVALRSPSENFNQDERNLLATIAALTAVTVHTVQLSEELRRSRQRIVTTREEERRRLRRDLHDDLGPQLASQTLGLEAVSQLIPTDPQKAQVLLDTLKDQGQNAFSDLRHLVYGLRPPVLDDQGLLAALEQCAAHFDTTDLKFELNLPKEIPELPAAVEAAVYRIALEAMTNVTRHAQASNCSIRLSIVQTEVILEVQDNGKGLPADIKTGVGLQSMKERATELNGEFQIHSLKEGGVIIQAKIPMEVTDE